MHSENTMQLRPNCNFNLEEHVVKITCYQIIHSTSSNLRNLAEQFPSTVSRKPESHWKNNTSLYSTIYVQNSYQPNEFG
jgi:hypothetical protein